MREVVLHSKRTKGFSVKVGSISEQSTLNLLAKTYYQVVPIELQTYCALTTAISRAVLLEFGIKSRAVPCQVWCSTADQNYLVGFLGTPRHAGKWDGHVICSAGEWFIDAALHHFVKDFGIEVPSIAVSRKFEAHTQVIGRLDLEEHKTLWWHSPPVGACTQVPNEPKALVSEYALKLVQAMRSLQLEHRFSH